MIDCKEYLSPLVSSSPFADAVQKQYLDMGMSGIIVFVPDMLCREMNNFTGLVTGVYFVFENRGPIMSK
jgi:hypothetical protein